MRMLRCSTSFHFSFLPLISSYCCILMVFYFIDYFHLLNAAQRIIAKRIRNNHGSEYGFLLDGLTILGFVILRHCSLSPSLSLLISLVLSFIFLGSFLLRYPGLYIWNPPLQYLISLLRECSAVDHIPDGGLQELAINAYRTSRWASYTLLKALRVSARTKRRPKIPSSLIYYRAINDRQNSIQPEDIYNFNKTGLTIGLIPTQKVVTQAESYGRRSILQPENCEWVTAIETICADGYSLPPYIIFKGKVANAGWFDNLLQD